MNAKQWRAQIDEIVKDAREGRMSVSAAHLFVKAFQVNVQSAQTQLNMYKMRKEQADIEFLKEE